MFTSKKRRPQGYNNNNTTTTSTSTTNSTTSTTTNNLIRKQIITTTHSVKIKKQLPPTNSYHPSPSTSNHNHNDNDNNSKRKRKNNDNNDKNDNANRDKSRKSPTPFSDESEGETIRKNGVDKLMKRKQSDSDPVSRQISASQDGTVQCLTAEQLVLDNREAYIEHFIDPFDPTRSALEWSGSELPTVVLEYPGTGATERFILLAAIRGAEEYDPITDLLGVIRLILDTFLTPSQSLFHFAHTLAPATAFSAFLSAPVSRDATPDGSPTASSFSPTPSTTTSTTVNDSMNNSIPLIRALERARAKKDGPAFLAAIARFNTVLVNLKQEGKMKENIEAMKGVAEKVWTKVVAQVYERAVGPEIERLSKYEAFSDNVYGELLPKFMMEICQQTGLGPNDVFVDLGSGVGNCVVQAALATGCQAYGYENMPAAALLASKQVKEAESRFRMYGISSGAMRTVEADFCEDPEVQAVLKRATVVLVNNEVFSAGLNDRLSLLFLDLPTNARIVSLKAFASSFTLSAYTLNSPLAIIEQGSERQYGRKSVSWKDEGGSYWIGRVDRERVERWKRREERRKSRRVIVA